MTKICCSISEPNRLKTLDSTKPDQTPNRLAAAKLTLCVYNEKKKKTYQAYTNVRKLNQTFLGNE